MRKTPTKDFGSPTISNKDKDLNELNNMGIKKNSELSSSLMRLQKLGIVPRFLEPPKEFMTKRPKSEMKKSKKGEPDNTEKIANTDRLMNRKLAELKHGIFN